MAIKANELSTEIRFANQGCENLDMMALEACIIDWGSAQRE
jgi:hypothetical protein